MFLVDITYPSGALGEDARAAIAEEVARGVLGGDAGDGPEATMRRARSMTHVRFHPAETWTTGNGGVPADQLPPYGVTITVPDAWRREVSSHAIGAVRTALLAHDPPREVGRQGGDLWINVVGVRDGSIGLDGQVSTADDVVMYMTEEQRSQADRAELPDGVLADPICGMHVRLGPDAITLDHDGETLGFCSKGCRSAFVKHEGLQGSGT